MAIDHDASEENNQPDHDGNRDEKAPPRKRWATERDEPVTTIGRHRNIMDVHLSLAVAPAGDDDVDSHVNSVGTRIGVSKGRATVYCDVGTMLRRELQGVWSVRRGTYRVLCRINDHTNEVIVLRIDHRRDVYR